MGGKSKIAKHIHEQMGADLEGATAYVEPFCGGLGMASYVTARAACPVVLSDVRPELIGLYRACLSGWTPPDHVTRADYEDARARSGSDPMRALMGFGMSYGGKWFGGFVGEYSNGRDYYGETKRALARKVGALKAHGNVTLLCGDYRTLDIPPGAVVYCDPPYAGTTSYDGVEPFDSRAFWTWVQRIARKATVYVSEYSAPEGVRQVWQKEYPNCLGTAARRSVERLYRVAPDDRGQRMYFSASSLKAYLECPRKAVMEAIGLKRPYAEALQRGHELHLALENYLKGRTPTIEDDLARYALPWLPEPSKRGVWVELGIGAPSDDAERYAATEHWTGLEDKIEGVPMRGIVDLVRIDRGVLEVWDHKTCSSFYWAETEDSLSSNLQLNLYADHLIRWLDYTGPVTLAHLQYLKPKGSAVPSAADVRCIKRTVHSALIRHRARVIQEIACAYVRDVQAAKVWLTHPNEASCGAYGGCHLAPMCATMPMSSHKPKSLLAKWLLTCHSTEF